MFRLRIDRGRAWSALVLAVVAVTWCFAVDRTVPEIGSGPFGPKFFPFVLGGALAVLSLALMTQALLREEASHPLTSNDRSKGQGLSVLALFAFLISYALALWLVGFALATLLAVPAGLLLAGQRSIVLISVLTVTVPAALKLLFGIALDVVLPSGYFFDVQL